LRGNPPWARSLRFFDAMNVLVESHVVQAQAASAFVAKRVMRGSPKQVSKSAASVLGHISELGSSRFADEARRSGLSEAPPAFAPGGAPPVPPGSWWTENESSRMEALSLQSGAAQMAQTAQIVRAPIAAGAGFGQHYLGDSSDANLATASTLELPATMRVTSWQQLFEDLLRWFTDRAIEAAVKSGKELSYEFVMPFPGRRQLTDVVTAVQTIGTSMDVNGVNVPLRRHLLRFFFEQIGIDDVGAAVAECLPEKGIPGGIGPQEEPVIDPATGEPKLGPDGTPLRKQAAVAPGDGGPGDGERPAGVKRGTTVDGKPTATSEQEWIPAELRSDVSAFSDSSAELFARLVKDPAVLAVAQLAGASSNGAG
jgi:hypothetical protein